MRRVIDTPEMLGILPGADSGTVRKVPKTLKQALIRAQREANRMAQ